MASITDIPHRIINAGAIAGGASIYVYEAGTLTTVSLFSDEGLTVPVSNPFVVAAGTPVPELFHGFNGQLHVKVVDSGSTVLFDDDPYDRPASANELLSAEFGKGAALVGVFGGTVEDVIVRQPLQVEAFYEAADGDDWAPAFTRAYAEGLVQRRNLVGTPSTPFRLLTSIEIVPDLDGWTPALDLQGATVILGKLVPDIADEYAGWRVRGIKSGAAANSTGFKVRNATVDAQDIAFSNGVRTVWMENASGWEIENFNGVNYRQGYHVANWRYADGGSVGAKPGIFKNSAIDGHALASVSEPTWYAYSEAGDLATVRPGDVVQDGEIAMIATTGTGSTGNNTPRIAASHLWENSSGSPIVVPLGLSNGDLAGAGLTDLGTTLTWQGATLTAPTYMYYSTASQKIADAVIRGRANVVRHVDVSGSRYGAYVSGSDGAVFDHVNVRDSIRGIAAEWSATHVSVLSCRIDDPLSSGILTGFGCTGWTVNDTSVFAMSARWVGEALFNFQLNCGDGFGRRNRTNTRNNVTNGQSHLHIAVNSPDVDFHCDIRGDCSKAYVAIESAWNSATAASVPELYVGGSPGGASTDMSNIRLSGSITPVSSKATNSGATMIALLQIADPVNGEIGLSGVDISGMKAGNNKIPVRYLKIYEGTTAAKQVNDCVLNDVEFPIEMAASTAASRMILPRKWAHFRLVRNVTNLDDNVERSVANVATPDLTFGKFWFDAGTTALNGILGGQGASINEGYEGREIIVRGNNSRAWTTVSVTSGTRDSLRITGSPLTPTNVQRMRFTFCRAHGAWIGGVV